MFSTTANSNSDLLIKQALAFKPNTVVIGDKSKYKTVDEARIELKRHIASQADLVNFQQSRQKFLQKKKALTQPRSAMPNGIFALDVLVD